MAIDLDAIFKKEAFTSLGTERVQLFKQFARDIEGKSIPEAAALYMKLNQGLAKEKPMTSTERSAVIKAIRDSLPEQDKVRFGQILKMLNIH